MIHLKMKNIMKSRKTTDSTRRKGRDAQADPDEDYLDQDYDDYDNEEEERIRRIKNKVLVRVSYLMVALFLSMAVCLPGTDHPRQYLFCGRQRPGTDRHCRRRDREQKLSVQQSVCTYCRLCNKW